MSRRRTNVEWRRDVFASRLPEMTPAVKVLLLYLADEMRAGGEVSIARDAIAKDLGIHKARVAERLAKAIEAGFLTRVQAGYPGRTAVYRRFWPDECVQQSGTHMDTAPPDASWSRSAGRIPDGVMRGMDTALRDAIDTEPQTSRTSERFPSVTGGDERRSNEQMPLEAEVDHRRPATHDREASA